MNLSPPLLRACTTIGKAARLARLAAVACAALSIVACSDEPEQTAATPVPARTTPTIHQMARLEKGDDVAPERWLASREAKRDLGSDAREVARIKQMLIEAQRDFREHPRMIANRAVQLEQMLREKRFEEPATQLIERLSEVAGGQRNVESFGAICQQYFNLRTQGLDQQHAVQVLKDGSHASN